MALAWVADGAPRNKNVNEELFSQLRWILNGVVNLYIKGL